VVIDDAVEFISGFRHVNLISVRYHVRRRQLGSHRRIRCSTRHAPRVCTEPRSVGTGNLDTVYRKLVTSGVWR